MSLLKEMYKQIPKPLLRNKWSLGFYISNEVYEKEKHNIIDGRFLGINIYTDDRIYKDNGVLKYK